MILGIGCDILDLKRFQKAASDDFVAHIFTPKERARANTLKGKRKWGYLAKRFSAKEAAVKACGCGIGEHIGWQDIEILNDASGAPTIHFSKKASGYIQKHFKCQKFKAHISLSDDGQSMAFVILEK